MGTPEIVVKRGLPCSSTLTPVGAPSGRSGDFSSVGASVFSAHSFSASEGWRFSKTSASGFSATCGRFDDCDCFFCMRTPMLCFDDREGPRIGQGTAVPCKRPVGRVECGWVGQIYPVRTARPKAHTLCSFRWRNQFLDLGSYLPGRSFPDPSLLKTVHCQNPICIS